MSIAFNLDVDLNEEVPLIPNVKLFASIQQAQMEKSLIRFLVHFLVFAA